MDGKPPVKERRGHVGHVTYLNLRSPVIIRNGWSQNHQYTRCISSVSLGKTNCNL